MKDHQITRLQDLLDFIADHLDEPLNLQNLAAQSCWSRWQLQRVFQLAYDTSVMNYVRQQRIASAAHRLVSTSASINDIVFATGYESQAVFSRTFKEQVGCTPKEYRQRGTLVNTLPKFLPPTLSTTSPLPQLAVDIKPKPSFLLYGFHTRFNGVHSQNPNNKEVLHELWKKTHIYMHRHNIKPNALTGLVDTTTAVNDEGDDITYWAGIEANAPTQYDELQAFLVPAQNYAVFTHTGPLHTLKTTLLRYLLEWIPASPYCSAEGFDLEYHSPTQFDTTADDFTIEFWMPIKLVTRSAPSL